MLTPRELSQAECERSTAKQAREDWLSGKISTIQLRDIFGKIDYRLQVAEGEADVLDEISQICCAAEWLEEFPIGGDEPTRARHYAFEAWQTHCAAPTFI